MSGVDTEARPPKAHRYFPVLRGRHHTPFLLVTGDSGWGRLTRAVNVGDAERPVVAKVSVLWLPVPVKSSRRALGNPGLCGLASVLPGYRIRR